MKGSIPLPIWLRKSLVILITILTFGLVSPTQILGLENLESTKHDFADSFEDHPVELSEPEELGLIIEEITFQTFMDKTMEEAELKSYEKFGTKIKPVIEDEFKEVILPQIENVIEAVARQYPEEELNNLIISEVPGGGTSEKIFHIVDGRTKQDVIRFHVRRDQPPKEGHWFNFHYHTYQDHFQSHYHLGTIFWDKNTPPKWKS